MEALQKALDSLRQQRGVLTEELAKVDTAIAQLEGLLDGKVAAVGGGAMRGASYEGLGIADAAMRYLREVGRAASTREIADQIRLRGVTTTSKNYTATVYAVLAGAKDRIVRTPDGWDLRGRDHASGEGLDGEEPGGGTKPSGGVEVHA